MELNQRILSQLFYFLYEIFTISFICYCQCNFLELGISKNYIGTLKSLIEEQTGINEQGWKKVPPCLLIY